MGVYNRRPSYFGGMMVRGLSFPEKGAKVEISQGEREGKSILAEGEAGGKILKQEGAGYKTGTQ